MAKKGRIAVAREWRQMLAARQSATRQRLIAAAISACFASAPTWGNPTAPQVVNGSASFTQAGKLLTVTNSNGAIINWNSFSIAAGETTRFNQASAGSSVLNRVLANDPSVLLGTLSSNGRVWLVNPAGIMVGQGARIDVAGFVASTLNVRNEDFLAGRLNFGATPNAGKVENYGQITTPSGGSVYLVAPAVTNNGIINTPNGEVLLAAGQTVQLIDTGTPGVNVAVTGATGNATNLGQIIAEAGRIGMAGVLVKNSGTLNASSVVREGGRIFLKAAQSVNLDVGSQIRADAGQAGNGGAVSVLAGDTAYVDGSISARGGARFGDGGMVETSGVHVHVADSARVSTLALHGKTGTWLVDPNDFTIGVDMSGAAVASALNGGDLTIQTATMGTPGGGDITVNENVAKTGATDSTLTLTAERNIVINAQVSSSSSKLHVNLYSDSAGAGSGAIVMNSGSSIASNGGDVKLAGRADGSGNAIGNSTYIDGIYLTGATIDAGGGAIALNGTGFAGTSSANGVYVTDASNVQTSGAGTITLNGTGGAGTNYNDGVRLGTNAALTSADGAIALNGWGKGSGVENIGVYVHNGAVVSATGTGAITFNGTGSSAGSTSNRGIRISASGGATQVKTTSGAIQMTGIGGADGDGIQVVSGALIQSTSGDIGLTGTGGAGASDERGIILDTSASVKTADGAITLTGTGGSSSGSSNYGVYLTGSSSTTGASIVSTGNGTITLDGTGGTGTNSNYGVRLSTGMHITSNNGDILIKGQGGGNGGGTNNYGIILTGTSGAVITSNGSANITLDGKGKGGAAGVNANAINGSTAGGNVTLIADTDSGADSIILTGAISGSGNLYLQPRSAATTIGIAGGAGTFNLSSTDLGWIQSGFANISIGRSDGTGAITFGDGAGGGYTFNASTVLQNAGASSGGIAINGAISTGLKNLTLNTTGNVTQIAPITAAGLQLLGAGATYDLTYGGNSISTLAADSGSISFTNGGSFSIGTIGAAGGDYSTTGVTASGDVTLVASGGGTITVSDTVTAGRGISLRADGNLLVNANLTANTASAGIASELIADSDNDRSGHITQSAGTTIATNSGNLTAAIVCGFGCEGGGGSSSGQDITFSGAVNAGGGQVLVRNEHGGAFTNGAGLISAQDLALRTERGIDLDAAVYRLTVRNALGGGAGDVAVRNTIDGSTLKLENFPGFRTFGAHGAAIGNKNGRLAISNDGSINIVNNVDSGAARMTLAAGDRIFQSGGNLYAKDLVLSAVNGIGCGECGGTQFLRTQVASLQATNTNRGVEIVNAGDLTLKDIEGVGYAVSNSNGAVRIQVRAGNALPGDLTVGDSVTAGRRFSLWADRDLLINANVSGTGRGDSSTSDLIADASVNGTGGITQNASSRITATFGGNLSIAVACTLGATCGGPSGGSTQNIVLGTVNAGTGTVRINTLNGGVQDANGAGTRNITAGDLMIRSEQGIDLDTAVTRVNLLNGQISNAGDVAIRNSGDLTLDNFYFGNAVENLGGAVRLASSGTINLAGGTIRAVQDVNFDAGNLTAGNASVSAGHDIFATVSGDLRLDGSGFTASNDIFVKLKDSKSTLHFNDAGELKAFLWAQAATTIHLDFLARSAGGMMVNGNAVDPLKFAAAPGGSGLFNGAARDAATIGNGLDVVYGLVVTTAPASDPIAAILNAPQRADPNSSPGGSGSSADGASYGGTPGSDAADFNTIGGTQGNFAGADSDAGLKKPADRPVVAKFGTCR